MKELTIAEIVTIMVALDQRAERMSKLAEEYEFTDSEGYFTNAAREARDLYTKMGNY